MFHVLKTPVYRFDLYGKQQTLYTDEDNFWQCYLEFVYKSTYQIWCKSVSMYPRSQYTGLVYMGDTSGPKQPIFNSDWSMPNRRLFAKFKVCSCLCTDEIVITTDERTDIAQMSWNFALIKCLQGTEYQIIIFRCYKRIGKTNISTMRRV